jgi:hypothetical protein
MRLIDADALKIPSEEMIAKMIIDSAPSIDIVRCKECKWQSVVTDDEEGTSYYMCGVWANATDENVFCSYGEREGE